MQFPREKTLLFSQQGSKHCTFAGDPKPPVWPALGTAGLTQDISETIGPGLWEKGFLKPKPGPAWITTQA